MAEIEVSKGASDTVRIIIPQAISYSALKGEQSDINEILNLPNVVDAPVKAGDVLGSITIYRDGLQWQSFDLVAETDVERGGLWRTWKKLLRHIW